MTIYVITYQEDNGACGDPDCCGDVSYYTRIVDQGFTSSDAANAWIDQNPNRHRDYQIQTVEVAR